MKKNWIYFISGLLSAGLFSIAVQAVGQPSTDTSPVYPPPIGLSNVPDDVYIRISAKSTKIEFMNGKGKKMPNEIYVGHERPINIEKILPEKIIKTIDQVLIFSGSPTCTFYDGWVRCP